jgi:putative chitinase
MNMLTIAQLLEIMPHAGKERAAQFLSHINSAMLEFSITTPSRQAAFLAQIAHESGSLRYVREIADGSAYDTRADLGNTRAEAVRLARQDGTTPGRMYRGRGLIQITGYDNYRACSQGLLNDPDMLPEHPDMLEMPTLAVRSAAWYWNSRSLNSFADAGQFETITRKINGGLNGQADRLQYFERAKRVLVDGGPAAAPVPFPQPNQKPEMPKWLHSFLQLFRP